MPELPEVETIRQDLRKKILDKKIITVDFLHTKVAQGSTKHITDELAGSSFTEIDRVGKLLIFKIATPDRYLLIHLKMTGQLIYRIGEKIYAGGHSMSTLQTELPDKHTQFIITFADGSKLYFNDLRRFGYVKIVDSLELERIKKTYGIEPLTKTFTLEALTTTLKHKKTILKAFLLNQKYLAGIGNIYADEIAHSAHLKPTRNLTTLSVHDISTLFTSIEKILAKAVKHRGTTFNNYVDSDGNKGNFSAHLKVYEQVGKPCDRCRTSLIKKTRVAGRGTYWCSECQT